MNLHSHYTTFFVTGEQFSAEFEAINPFKKVPVIDDKGFILTERYVKYYVLNVLMILVS